MTDITELAQREKFEAWFKSSFHPDKTGPYIKDQLYFAWKAAGAELVQALEKAQRYIEELREWNAGLAQESFERQQCIIELQHRHEVDPRTHEIIDLKERIADLESRTVKLPDDAEHDIMAPVAAYLSEKFKWDGSAARWDGRKEYDVLADRVKYALRMVIRRAAGIKVEAD